MAAAAAVVPVLSLSTVGPNLTVISAVSGRNEWEKDNDYTE